MHSVTLIHALNDAAMKHALNDFSMTYAVSDSFMRHVLKDSHGVCTQWNSHDICIGKLWLVEFQWNNKMFWGKYTYKNKRKKITLSYHLLQIIQGTFYASWHQADSVSNSWQCILKLFFPNIHWTLLISNNSLASISFTACLLSCNSWCAKREPAGSFIPILQCHFVLRHVSRRGTEDKLNMGK